MDSEHKNRNGGEGRHAGQVASREAEKGSGDDHGALLQSADVALPRASLREVPVSAKRRRAERRQTSALIALWGEVERRSGEDQRTSPSGNDIDHD